MATEQQALEMKGATGVGGSQVSFGIDGFGLQEAIDPLQYGGHIDTERIANS